MEHENMHPDFGTGQKKLSTYLFGLVNCIILTLISFAAVLAGIFSKKEIFIIIYISAVIQFFVQLIFFLRLNTQTEQARINVMSIIFTVVILLSVVVGSLWIMWNLDYNMIH